MLNFTTRRINRRGVAMLLAAALVLIPGTALAGGQWTATAPIQAGNEYCGADRPDLPNVGSVSFDRKGARLAMTFVLDGASTNESYSAMLYGGDCKLVMTLGTINTDAYGNGYAQYSVRASGKSFFATIHGSAGFSDTPIVP